MPELPEVDAVVRRLNESLTGAAVVSAHIERPGIIAPQDPASFAVLHGAKFLEARRRAKHIFLYFNHPQRIEVHLRMTGNLYAVPDYNFRPHTARAWFRLADGRALVYDDQRALGRLHLVTDEDIARTDASLGPEPLEPAFTPKVLAAALATTRSPIKPVLLDQARIAGIGNIYASEALWHARIHPATPANQISGRQLTRLHSAIRKVLKTAVASAYAEYTRPGTIGDEPEVYGRAGEPCSRCHTPIERSVQATRSTFFCPHCQPC